MTALYIKVKYSNGKGMYFAPYFRKVDDNISIKGNYVYVFNTDDKEKALEQAQDEGYIYYNVKYERYEFRKDYIIRVFLYGE